MSKAKILNNLKGRVAFVNDMTAISGLDFSEGLADLKELIAEGKVETEVVTLGTDKFNRPVQGTLYRAIARNIPEGLSLVK